MAKNVRFIRTTKGKWLARDTYDPLALYFCEDTQEMCKGDQVLTDGIRVVPTKSDLPECPYAADGVIYYVAETKNGYMMSPDRTEWLQTIYAPAKDVSKIPESEIYKTVTTVGAVRDIESAIYQYVDAKIGNAGTGGGGMSEVFDDVVTTIGYEGIAAGTSLKGKTVKDVLVMLLGIQAPPKSVIEYIMSNRIPLYSGLEGDESVEIPYRQLDSDTANYTDQGFYVTNPNGTITNAGYQVTFEGNTEGITQTFSVYSEAKIVTAYQYQPTLNQWLEMGFDETYWIETGTMTKVVNGQEVIYTTYSYNTELMGDVITATEYWRFEVEVS